MITIRLSRHGKKNDPFYKIVAIEKEKKREGKGIEELGYFHPAKALKKVDKKRIEDLVLKGAQVSMAVKKLLT